MIEARDPIHWPTPTRIADGSIQIRISQRQRWTPQTGDTVELDGEILDYVTGDEGDTLQRAGVVVCEVTVERQGVRVR